MALQGFVHGIFHQFAAFQTLLSCHGMERKKGEVDRCLAVSFSTWTRGLMKWKGPLQAAHADMLHLSPTSDMTEGGRRHYKQGDRITCVFFTLRFDSMRKGAFFEDFEIVVSFA